jgi:release factor glutamine methyltransferase
MSGTLQASYISARKALQNGGIEQADLEARWILKSVLGIGDSRLITGEGTVSREQQAKIDETIARRLAGEPLSRILGEREFWGLKFAIGPETLDPRPDTETLVRVALEILTKKFHVKQGNPSKAAEILDLGTGSGAILLSILHENAAFTGVGTDLSHETLKIACHNAKNLGVSGRAVFICGDWAAAISHKFDLVVSNPPYIRRSVIPNLEKEVRNHDPILALDGGEDGLEAYKKIFSQLPHLLKPGGTALLEIGFDQADDLARLSREPWIRKNYTHTDYAGRPRVVEISCGDK